MRIFSESAALRKVDFVSRQSKLLCNALSLSRSQTTTPLLKICLYGLSHRKKMFVAAIVAIIVATAAGAKILEADHHTPAINPAMVEHINVCEFNFSLLIRGLFYVWKILICSVELEDHLDCRNFSTFRQRHHCPCQENVGYCHAW